MTKSNTGTGARAIMTGHAGEASRILAAFLGEHSEGFRKGGTPADALRIRKKYIAQIEQLAGRDSFAAARDLTKNGIAITDDGLVLFTREMTEDLRDRFTDWLNDESDTKPYYYIRLRASNEDQV